MADVTFAGVVKRFGEATVIKDFDLQVRDQEFMVLVGPSGCGKSTLLRMLAGLEEISEGTIAIGGRVVNGVAPKDRDVAMVFQNYALYPHMTVRENLEFGLKMRKTPRAERERLVKEAAAILAIPHLLDRRPRQLSGGQRQRVAVGRAIVRKPAVFLFDEPLSNLDAKLRVQMRSEITRLQQQLATTTVYVTHDQVEAMTMGQRIAIMNQGELMQVGTPQEVYQRPDNVFVASFIGVPPMNLIAGSLDEGAETVEFAGVRVPLPAPLRTGAAAHGGGPVTVGIRPEHLPAADGGPRGGTPHLAVTVELVEQLGHEMVVYGRAGRDPVIARQPPSVEPRPGDTLELVVDADALHLFDAATGARLGA